MMTQFGFRLVKRTFAIVLAVYLLSPVLSQQSSQPRVSIEQLWAEASTAQQHQQYARAAEFYRKILAMQPDFTEAKVNLGIILHLAGKLQEAVICFDQVLSRHPDLLAPNLIAGLDDLKLDNPEAALPHLQKAVKLNPGSIEAQIGLADSYLQLQRYGEAVDQFRRATELNGQYAGAWYGLGAAYLNIEKRTESELHRSVSPFRLVFLGQLYLQQAQSDKAVNVLSSEIAVSKEVPCARSLLGFAYLQESKLIDARQQFEIDWNPRSGQGCLLGKLGIAALSEKNGDSQAAVQEISEAAAIDPEFVATNAGTYLPELTMGGEESEVGQILASQHEESVELETPENDAKTGHYSACTSTLGSNKEHLDVEQLRLLCFCAYSTGEDEVAMDASGRILNQIGADPEALYWRVQSAERLALAAITKAAELDPDSASHYALMGDLLQDKGDFAGAATDYRRAISIKPTFLAARLGLARSLNSDQRMDEAAQELHNALNLNPNDAEANYLMGDILLNRSQPAKALPFLLKSLRGAPEEFPYVHADLSKVYEDQGETSKAIAELKQAISADVDGSFSYRLGRLYLKAGDRAAAQEAFDLAERLRHATDAASQFVK